MDWFTADWHLFHEKMIPLANRPFSCAEEMKEKLISNYNSVVKKGDRVYFIGDFALNYYRDTQAQVESVLNRLTGQKFLVVGNHDPKEVYNARGWANRGSVTEIITIRSICDQRIVLCHYAMRVWPGSHNGHWHLFGHSHGNMKDDHGSLSMDVGVDCWNFFPISFDDVRAKMARKTFVPVDHHVKKEVEGCE